MYYETAEITPAQAAAPAVTADTLLPYCYPATDSCEYVLTCCDYKVLD